MADKKVIKLARKGDIDAFVSLYSEVYKDLYYTAVCLSDTQREANEAVIEMIVTSSKKIKRFGKKDSFKLFMMENLINYIEENGLCGEKESVLDIISYDAESYGVEVLNEIRKLDKLDRYCFSLKAMGNCSIDEVSQMTGHKKKHVNQYILNAKNKLKQSFMER